MYTVCTSLDNRVSKLTSLWAGYPQSGSYPFKANYWAVAMINYMPLCA